MEIIGVYDLAERKTQGGKRRKFFLVRGKMNPVIIVPDAVTAIVDVSSGRKADDGIGMNHVFAAIYICPGLFFDQQNKKVWETGFVFDIAGF